MGVGSQGKESLYTYRYNFFLSLFMRALLRRRPGGSIYFDFASIILLFFPQLQLSVVRFSCEFCWLSSKFSKDFKFYSITLLIVPFHFIFIFYFLFFLFCFATDIYLESIMAPRKKALLKVIILGDSGVGKTSLMYVVGFYDHISFPSSPLTLSLL